MKRIVLRIGIARYCMLPEILAAKRVVFVDLIRTIDRLIILGRSGYDLMAIVALSS